MPATGRRYRFPCVAARLTTYRAANPTVGAALARGMDAYDVAIYDTRHDRRIGRCIVGSHRRRGKCRRLHYPRAQDSNKNLRRNRDQHKCRRHNSSILANPSRNRSAGNFPDRRSCRFPLPLIGRRKIVQPVPGTRPFAFIIGLDLG